MPVSTPIHLPYCLSLILGLQPRSVLDIGCGFGTWGFLCRTHLDVFPGRVQPHEWITRIDGIELFEPYIQAHQRALYDNIHIEDIRTAVEKIDEYDLIIAGDVIEHLDKDDAEAVLDCLYAKARKALLVNIPIGAEGWDHPEMHGNPGELHRSAWEPDDFLPYPNLHKAFTLPNGAYGVFWCPRTVDGEARLSGIIASADRAARAGRLSRAHTLLRQAHALAPTDALVAAFLADTALTLGEREEALSVLREASGTDPEGQRIRLALAQLQARLGQLDAARTTLADLRAIPSLDPSLQVEANTLLQGLS